MNVRPPAGQGNVGTRIPVFRISMKNATVLSALYLVFAAAVELTRRLFAFRWAESLSKALEEFPARVLHLVGLFEPLRDAYLRGNVNELVVRLAYGVTVVVIVFAMGLIVGGLLWLLARNARMPPEGY